MSHQLCQNCGSNQFEHIDGRVYCIVCQSQNVSLQVHVSFANEGSAQLGRRVRDQLQTSSMLNETIPKIEIFEVNETLAYPSNPTDETTSQMNNLSVDDNEHSLLEQHVWSHYEAYSYILNLQVQALIDLKHIEVDKHNDLIECTFMLYLRYLSANGIIDTNQQRPLMKQEERRLKANDLSKVIYADRYDQWKKTNMHIFRKDICKINLDILIGLIHCACTLINSPITVKQLIELINTSKVPYYDIRTYLPTWMRSAGRDRFKLEKMNIHCEQLFFYHNDFIRPVIKSYLSQCLFQSPLYFYEMLMNVCKTLCTQIYFPFDADTRSSFESLCRKVVELKSKGRRFLSTSFDIELASLSIIITIILLRSINDNLLDRFIQHLSRNETCPEFFSYSLWLKSLNSLVYHQTVRYNQFYGRQSVLLQSVTDNHSKIRYTKHLSKVFDRTVTLNQNEKSETIRGKENEIRQILIKNSTAGSLNYAFKTEEFFSKRFPNLSTESCSTRFEFIVNNYSPSEFSIVDRSELYETLLSLINGTTINQVESFYLLHQRFHFAASINIHLNHLIETLTRFCSIPYGQDFYSFLSKFLATFCFSSQDLHHYFLSSTRSRRYDLVNMSKDIGMKAYGVDQLPVAYDLKFEQEPVLIKDQKQE